MSTLRHISLLSLSLFFFTVSCITDIGKPAATDHGLGNIHVWEKNGIAGNVYLDYRTTGLTTPATIENVPEGNHTLHVFYHGYRSEPEFTSVEVFAKQFTDIVVELKKATYGTLTVTTVPPGAMVTINNVDHGTSPLTVNGLAAGTYAIAAQKENYRSRDTVVSVSPTENPQLVLNCIANRFVAVEYFSNTSCAGCPAAGGAIDQLLEQLPGYKDRVYKIAYHADFPSKNDPFYLAAKDSILKRMTLYGVDKDPGGLPIIYINGEKLMFQKPESIIPDAKSAIALLMSKPAVAEFTYNAIARDSLVASGSLSIKTTRTGDLLFIALVEDFVGYAAPPGTNGEKSFNSIFRGFATQANGLEIIEPETSVPFSFAITAYSRSGLHAVAFLQDKTTREIVQSLCVKL